MRLSQLERRDANFLFQRAAKVSLTHTKIARELGDTPAIERAIGDTLGCGVRETRERITGGAARRELWPAAEARPKSGTLRRRRRPEKPTVVVVRHARWTDRTTVDPRGRDADEKHAVEARIARVECPHEYRVGIECGAVGRKARQSEYG
jgi:hypothetical protein